MGVFEKSNGLRIEKSRVIPKRRGKRNDKAFSRPVHRIRVSIFSLNSRGTLPHIYTHIYISIRREICIRHRERERFFYSFLRLPSSSSSASGSRTFHCKIVIHRTNFYFFLSFLILFRSKKRIINYC